ncbi:MAG: hypothetical protein FWE59_00830 [Oscillospiraceae bacterium]|nr:hypothetical protein [Oscillospiraceae bacterium]
MDPGSCDCAQDDGGWCGIPIASPLVGGTRGGASPTSHRRWTAGRTGWIAVGWRDARGRVPYNAPPWDGGTHRVDRRWSAGRAGARPLQRAATTAVGCGDGTRGGASPTTHRRGTAGRAGWDAVGRRDAPDGTP